MLFIAFHSNHWLFYNPTTEAFTAKQKWKVSVFLCASLPGQRWALANQSNATNSVWSDVCRSLNWSEDSRQLIWWDELRGLVKRQITTSGLPEPISALSVCPCVISIYSFCTRCSLCSLWRSFRGDTRAHADGRTHTHTHLISFDFVPTHETQAHMQKHTCTQRLSSNLIVLRGLSILENR